MVGGGIAGLACATELADRGVDVILLEARSRCGGPAETRRIGEFLIERGPCTVRATPELLELIRRVELEVQRARGGGPYLARGGRLVGVPPSLASLLRGDLLPLRGCLQALAEPFRPHPSGPRSVAELVRERFGPIVAAELADVATLVIYGATADRVGFESAYPALAEGLARSGTLFRMALGRLLERRRAASSTRAPRPGGLVSTPEGLGALPARLSTQLGERVRLNSPVRQVWPRAGGFELRIGASGETKLSSQHLVIATPPESAAEFLEIPRVRRLMGGYRSTPQTLASFALEDADCAARWTGFGFLAPSRERLPLRGCLFPSALFPGRAPAGWLLMTVFVGPELVDAPDAMLAAEIAPILERLTRAVRKPELLDVARYPEGITLYDRRHRDRTRLLRRAFDRNAGPLLAGAAYDGVAFGAAAASGVSAAHRVLDSL